MSKPLENLTEEEYATLIEPSEDMQRVRITLYFSRPIIGEDILVSLHNLIEEHADDPDYIIDYRNTLKDERH